MSQLLQSLQWSLCRLVAVACIALTAQQASANIITNGTFESYSNFFANPGSPVSSGGWTFENHAGVVDGGNPEKAVRLESGGNTTWDPTIAQTVSGLNVGTSYTVSWDLALRVNFAGSGTDRSFGVFLDTQSFANALLFDEHLYTTYKSDSVSFIATSTSHTLIFAGELDNRTNGGVGNTDVSYNIDNIAMAATVPEPTTLASLISGSLAAAVIALRRRRKK